MMSKIFKLATRLSFFQMASFLTGAARAAHSAAAGILARGQIGVGDDIPALKVKEDDPEKSFTLDLSGKNIIVRDA